MKRLRVEDLSKPQQIMVYEHYRTCCSLMQACGEELLFRLRALPDPNGDIARIAQGFKGAIEEIRTNSTEWVNQTFAENFEEIRPSTLN